MLSGLVLIAATVFSGIDPTVETGINVVIYRRRLPDAQMQLATIALVDAAEQNRRIADDLRFIAIESRLAQRARQNYGDLLYLMKNDAEVTRESHELGQLFDGDGVLPSVRYKWSKGEDRDYLKRAYDEASDDLLTSDLYEEYDKHREHGDTPDQALSQLQAKKKHFEPAISAVAGPIEKLGRLMLTGYSDVDSDNDFQNCLEARYAKRHPNAKDILGLRAWVPSDYMNQRVQIAMLFDETKMMSRIRRVIDSAIAPSNRQPVGRAPGIVNLPKSSTLGLAGLPRDADQMSEVVIQCGGKNCDRSVLDPYEPEKDRWAFSFDGSDSEAMAWLTPCWKKVSDAYGTSLDSNAWYEVTFAPWYWADVDGAAYLCALPPINSEPYRSQAGSQGRVNLPSSSGGPVEVTIRVKTDASGRMKIGVVPVGQCAIAIGRVWVRRV